MIGCVAYAADPTTNLPLDARRRQLFEGVCGLIEADAWLWLAGSLTDGVDQTCTALCRLHAGWHDEDELRRTLEVFDELVMNSLLEERSSPTPTRKIANSDDASSLTAGTAEESPAHAALRAIGLDGVLSAVRCPERGDYSLVGYFRRAGSMAFTER